MGDQNKHLTNEEIRITVGFDRIEGEKREKLRSRVYDHIMHCEDCSRKISKAHDLLLMSGTLQEENALSKLSLIDSPEKKQEMERLFHVFEKSAEIEKKREL